MCKKKKENEGKEEQAGELKAFRQKDILLMKEMPYSAWPRAFIANPSYKIPKNQKKILLQWGKLGRKPKR